MLLIGIKNPQMNNFKKNSDAWLNIVQSYSGIYKLLLLLRSYLPVRLTYVDTYL